jgi:hypothetical protein
MSARMQGFIKRWSDPNRPTILPKQSIFLTHPWVDYWKFTGLSYQGFMNMTPAVVTSKIGASNGYRDWETECEWYVKFSDGTRLHMFYKVDDPLLYIHGTDSSAITRARSILF